jgi:hypothetical protein
VWFDSGIGIKMGRFRMTEKIQAGKGDLMIYRILSNRWTTAADL